jgi:hypothetical protein
MRTWPRTDGRTALRTIDRTSVGLPSDPFFSSTTLLLPGNGTNGAQNNTFLDSSTNAFSITRNGNTTQGTFSPFPPASGTAYSAAANGGSGSFDGTGDSLSLASNSAFNLGTGEFTVECWVYPTNPSGNAGYQMLVNRTNYSANTGWGLWIQVSKFGFWMDGASTQINDASAITANTWYHLAAVRNASNVVTLYVNGTSVGSTTLSSFTDSTTALGVGARGETSSWNAEYGVFGYMSNVRIVKGTAVYTANFTPPTAPLTAISGTSLLLNFTNAGVLDATGKNDLETVGNAQISTAQSKWGGASIAFDGTGDWLRTPTSPNLDMGTGDLTIEGWFYLTATVAVDYRMIVSDATNGNNYVAIRSGGTGGQLEINVNGTSFRLNLNNSVTINTWFHLAVTRYSGTWYGFVNGASLGSNASAAAFNLGNGGMFVGRFGGATAYEWPGYMDDLRITKGVARYTAAFTPPTAAFPLR